MIGPISIAAAQTPVPGEAEDLDPLFAPFVSRAFIEAIVEDLAQLQIEEERVDGVYLDPTTGFLWATQDNGRDIDWRRAATYCVGLVLAGYDDWALPSLEALESLLRPMAKGAYNLPVKFQLTACCPWSSTSEDEKSAWNLQFPVQQALLRCVLLHLRSSGPVYENTAGRGATPDRGPAEGGTQEVIEPSPESDRREW